MQPDTPPTDINARPPGPFHSITPPQPAAMPTESPNTTSSSDPSPEITTPDRLAIDHRSNSPLQTYAHCFAKDEGGISKDVDEDGTVDDAISLSVPVRLRIDLFSSTGQSASSIAPQAVSPGPELHEESESFNTTRVQVIEVDADMVEQGPESEYVAVRDLSDFVPGPDPPTPPADPPGELEAINAAHPPLLGSHRRKRHLDEEADAQADLDDEQKYKPRTKASPSFTSRGPQRHRTMVAARQRRTSGTSAYPASESTQSSSSRLQQAMSGTPPSSPRRSSINDPPQLSRRSTSPSPLPKRSKLSNEQLSADSLEYESGEGESSSSSRLPDSPRVYSRSTSTFRIDTPTSASSEAPRQWRSRSRAASPPCENGGEGENSDVILIDSIESLHPILHIDQVSRRCYGCLMSPRGKARKEKKHPQDVARRFLDCSRCTTVIWCSVKCYATHANNHFAECRALVECKNCPTAEVRLLARACFDHRKESLDATSLPSLKHSDMLELAPLLRDLTSFLSKVHSAKNKENKLDYQEYGFKTVNDFLIWLRKTRRNIVPVTDCNDISLGVCLYPLEGFPSNTDKTGALGASPRTIKTQPGALDRVSNVRDSKTNPSSTPSGRRKRAGSDENDRMSRVLDGNPWKRRARSVSVSRSREEVLLELEQNEEGRDKDDEAEVEAVTACPGSVSQEAIEAGCHGEGGGFLPEGPEGPEVPEGFGASEDWGHVRILAEVMDQESLAAMGAEGEDVIID